MLATRSLEKNATKFALKLVNPRKEPKEIEEGTESLKKEAKIMRKLNHQNILRYYDFIEN